MQTLHIPNKLLLNQAAAEGVSCSPEIKLVGSCDSLERYAISMDIAPRTLSVESSHAVVGDCHRLLHFTCTVILGERLGIHLTSASLRPQSL